MIMFNEETPKMQVKCDVANCTYNKSKTCHANSLDVSTCGDGQADTCDGTRCSTFKKGNSYSM